MSSSSLSSSSSSSFSTMRQQQHQQPTRHWPQRVFHVVWLVLGLTWLLFTLHLNDVHDQEALRLYQQQQRQQQSHYNSPLPHQQQPETTQQDLHSYYQVSSSSMSSSTRTLTSSSPISSSSSTSSIMLQEPSARRNEIKPDHAVRSLSWNCSRSSTRYMDHNDDDNHHSDNSDNSNKFILIHVFKTAGSSLRHLLTHHYGPNCQRTVSVVGGCSAWATPDGPNEPWTNQLHPNKYKRCELMEQVEPTTTTTSSLTQQQEHDEDEQEPHPLFVTNAYVQQHTDILAGHVTLGVHRAWENHNDSDESDVNHDEHNNHDNPPYRYMTFVRQAAHKVVSGWVYVQQQQHPDTTWDDMLNIIKRKLATAHARGDVKDSYSRYWLLPEQYDVVNSTIEQRVAWMQQNLVEYGVVMGVVEEMDQSLQLLQHVLDPSLPMSTTGTSDTVENSSTTNNNTNSLIRHLNPSLWSTDHMVQLLLQNETIAEQLRAYTRYDQQLYEFGLQLHRQQYRATFGKSDEATQQKSTDES